jgi:hypothetical protein
MNSLREFLPPCSGTIHRFGGRCVFHQGRPCFGLIYSLFHNLSLIRQISLPFPISIIRFGEIIASFFSSYSRFRRKSLPRFGIYFCVSEELSIHMSWPILLFRMRFLYPFQGRFFCFWRNFVCPFEGRFFCFGGGFCTHSRAEYSFSGELNISISGKIILFRRRFLYLYQGRSSVSEELCIPISWPIFLFRKNFVYPFQGRLFCFGGTSYVHFKADSSVS